MQILGPDNQLNVASRRVIQLAWNGILYSREKYSMNEVSNSASRQGGAAPLSNASRTSTEQVWTSLGTGAMTSMVLMLDYIPRISNIIQMQFSSWSLDNLTEMMRCMEAAYHHARCFNNDSDLRSKLQRKGFMRFKTDPQKLPHLLEQETSSLFHILTIAFKLFAEEGGPHLDASGRSSLAEISLIRCAIVCLPRLAFLIMCL